MTTEEGRKKIIFILGPTGVGKSRFAIELSKIIDGEIISADSMAVYKGINIATDKVPIEQREGIPHHLYDLIETDDFFSAGLFRRIALEKIEEILHRRKIPIIVGGTGFYVKALLDGLLEAPPRCEILRQRLKKIAENKGKKFLYNILQKTDSERAKEINENDLVRIIRALEIRILTKKKFKELVKETQKELKGYECFKICLYHNRELLYKKIEERVDSMIERGLVEEVKNLYKNKKLSGPIEKAIGIKELIPYFENKIDLESAILEIKKNSRNLAKRQLTWFKKENGLKWLMIDNEEEKEKLIKEIITWLKGGSNEQGN